MGHFSLGKLYLDERRYIQSAKSLEEAARLDPTYAAALVALGDAYAGQGELERARQAYELARKTPLAAKDASLVEEIERRLEEL
jgi:Tfp pilus assembly protein PilF